MGHFLIHDKGRAVDPIFFGGADSHRVFTVHCTTAARACVCVCVTFLQLMMSSTMAEELKHIKRKMSRITITVSRQCYG